MMNIKKIVFVNYACETGGPECIHQTCSFLTENGFDASMFYIDGAKQHPSKFLHYNNKLRQSLDVDDETLVVFPEIVDLNEIKAVNSIKAINWLSVDNTKTTKIVNLDEALKDAGVEFHFVQSQYARNFLEVYNLKNIFDLPDYTNEKYLESRAKKARKPYVLYNPKKGMDFTQKVVYLNKDIKFIPIINMSIDEIIDLMDESMVYIDFGNHPGKDRIPREAICRDLIVITNFNGSAGNDVDVPIDLKYKVHSTYNNLRKISDLLHSCLKNYDVDILNFKRAKETMLAEKERFKKTTLNVFNQIVKM